MRLWIRNAALLVLALCALSLSKTAGAIQEAYEPLAETAWAAQSAYHTQDAREAREDLDAVLMDFYADDHLTESELAFLLSVTGTENEEAVFLYLTEKGLNCAAVCGVMANLVCESWGFNPINLERRYETSLGYTDEEYTAAVDDGSYENFIYDSAGYGICQWTYWSRKQELLEFARSRECSIGDLDMQLDFLWRELSRSRLLGTLRAVEDSREGAYQAGYEFCVQFERPADMERMGEIRGNLAKDTYWLEYGPEPTPTPTSEPTGIPTPTPTDEPIGTHTPTPTPQAETCIISVRRSVDSAGEINGDTVTVTALCTEMDAPGAVLYCGTFDAEGEMLAVQSLPAAAGTETYLFSLEAPADSATTSTESTETPASDPEASAVCVKVFLLDAAGRPLCASAGE